MLHAVRSWPSRTNRWGDASDAPLGHGLRGLARRPRGTQLSSESEWGVAPPGLDMRESGGSMGRRVTNPFMAYP
jgi:hypothetical protein